MVAFSQIVVDQWKRLTIAPTDCTGQTIIVTGSNTGIGLEAARHFVRLGAARVIIAVRSAAKGDAAKEYVETATGRRGVAEVWPLDLASNHSISAFAERANNELDRIDVVLENAGVAMGEWTEAEGTELTIQVNVIGTMLLALLLLPALKRTSLKYNITSHLTIVSSTLHHDAQFLEGKQDNIFAALAENKPSYMADRLLPVDKTGVVINLLCPGLCWTELTRNVPWGMWLQITIMRIFLARSAEVGSRTLLHAAVAGPESHGEVCGDCEIRDDKTAPFVKNEEGQRMQKRVWNQLVAKLEAIDPHCLRNAL